MAEMLERRAEHRDVDRPGADWAGPGRQAYRMLRLGFVVAPTLAGLDKFFEVLTDWDRYLAPPFAQLLGGHTFMLVAPGRWRFLRVWWSRCGRG